MQLVQKLHKNFSINIDKSNKFRYNVVIKTNEGERTIQKKEDGITLLALIITIIVILLLAGGVIT